LDFYATDISVDFVGENCTTSTGEALRYGDIMDPCHCMLEKDCQCQSQGCDSTRESCSYPQDGTGTVEEEKYPISDEIEMEFFTL
jgi:hypothetical protein